MNPWHTPADCSTGAVPAPDSSPPPHPGMPPAMAGLFRHSLAQGRLHPLMPLLLRYRQGQDAAAVGAPAAPGQEGPEPLGPEGATRRAAR